MSKTEFLEELAQHLQVLEEGEQQDILAEYAQHIDMKMQGGLSEEEAIRDFGPIRELAAEILTAYHVRPDFSPEEEKGRVIYVKGPDLEKVKERGKQAADAVGRQAGRFGVWFRTLCGNLRAAWGRLAGKVKKRFSAESSQGEVRPAGSAPRARGSIPGLGAGLSRFFHWLGRVIATLARWLWNACWAAASVILGFCGLAALFFFGLLLVWAVKGYPFVGITMCALGLALALGALALLGATLIWTKIRLNVQVSPSRPEPARAEEEAARAAQPAPHVWPEDACPALDPGPAEKPTDEAPADEAHPQEGGNHHA